MGCVPIRPLLLLGPALALVLAAGPARSAMVLRPVQSAEFQAVETTSVGSEGAIGDLTDGRLGSAWISARGRAVGEAVTLRFGATRYVTRVDVLPGWGKDNIAFKQYARPAKVRIAWDGGEETFDLDDRRVLQPLELGTLARTRTLVVTVEAIHGRAAPGVAISEIMPYEPEDVLAVEPELRERIQAEVLALAEDPGNAALFERLVAYGRPVVPWLLEPVRHGEPAAAVVALRALRQLDRDRGDALVRQLTAGDDAARVEVALRALAGAPVSGLASPLLAVADRLEPAPGPAYALALDALARTGDPRALPFAARALASSDPGRVEVAVAALHHLGEAARDEAIRLARAGDEPVRVAAVAALGTFAGDGAAAATLTELTRDPSPDLRRAAVSALGTLGGPHARATLEELVTSRDRATSEAAFPAILALGDDAVPKLRAILDGPHAELHERALDAMARTRTDAARTVLVEAMLGESHPTWHRHAVRALAAHGRAGIDALLAAVQADPARADRAARFLVRVADAAAEPATELLAGLLPDRDLDPLRVLLLDAIQRAAYAPAADVVMRVYGDITTSERVRRQALETLGFLDTPPVRDLVLREIAQPDGRLSLLAVQAAGRLGEVRATEPILAMLRARDVHDWNPDLVEALGALRAAEAMPLFRRAMEYPARSVQIAILRACQRIGGREAIRVLVEASVSPDRTLSRVAQNLLSKSE